MLAYADMIIWVALLTASFLIPTGMLASCAPRRKHFAARMSLSVVASYVVLFAVNYILRIVVPRPTVFDLATFIPSITFFGIVMIGLSALVFLCHETSIWVAIFCGTAGYIMQNMGQMLSDILVSPFPGIRDVGLGIVAHLPGMLVVYPLCYGLMVTRMREQNLVSISNKRMLGIVPFVLLVNIVASLSIGNLAPLGMPLVGIVVLQLLHLTACSLALLMEYELLVNEHMKATMAATERTLMERGRQYELSRQTIDAINVKFHDLKYQIQSLSESDHISRAALNDLSHDLRVYDAIFDTGNDALDTILTEKGLACEAEGISFACMVDGTVLRGMEPADIYALFGNALDNAIEAERTIADPTARSISLTVREVSNMALIHAENYFTNQVEIVDGLPQTTKEDKSWHGYGVRSMHLIVERYGGVLSLGNEGDTFFVNCLIPLR